MRNKILFYKLNGELDSTEQLNNHNLRHINGMMTRCTLINGTTEVGFADPLRTHDRNSFDDKIHDYIYLWTWDNLDEESHTLIGDDEDKYNQTFKKIDIGDITKVESILYSNPRFGGLLTNKFHIITES